MFGDRYGKPILGSGAESGLGQMCGLYSMDYNPLLGADLCLLGGNGSVQVTYSAPQAG